MSLHPEVEAILAAMSEAMPAVDFEQLNASALRGSMDMPPAENPEPVHQVEDRSIAGPESDIPIRIYRSSDAQDAPLVVFFHGGGFVIGNLETHDGLCRSLCNEAGATVVAVDYRLAPEHQYPAAPLDCYAATCWAADHAQELGADASKLLVAGDSAGGCLAAVVSQMARDKDGPAIAGQLLIYPVTDGVTDTASYQRNGEGYFLTAGMMQWFLQQYIADPEQINEPMASPLRHKKLAGLPKAMILTAEYDPLLDDGASYAKALTDAGVDTDYRCYDGMIHGFVSFPFGLTTAKDAISDMAAFIRAA